MPVAVAENRKQCLHVIAVSEGSCIALTFLSSSQISLSFGLENKQMVSSQSLLSTDITAHCGAAHSTPGQEEQAGSRTGLMI